MSMPIPAIIADRLLDRDRLGQVARLVDVEPLGARQLHAEDVQRRDGEQRLEHRRGQRNADHLVGMRDDLDVAELVMADREVALQLAALTFMIPLGVAQATSVLVGQAVGRADPPGARRAVIIPGSATVLLLHQPEQAESPSGRL